MSDSLRPHRLYSPWNSPGQNTEVGSLSLLQEIFPIQRSNPGLPHYRQILYQLRHQGNPRILERSFFIGSSRPRNLTQVSHTAGDSLPAEPQGKAEYIYTSVIMFLFLSFGRPVGHAGYQFSHWEWNPRPWHWQRGVLTTGLPARSLHLSLLCVVS